MNKCNQKWIFNSKCIVGVLTATALICVTSFQSSAQVGFALGAKGGIGITTFKGGDAQNVDARTSWLGGAFLNAQISPVFNIQPEILFSQKGADYTVEGSRRHLVINYFEVPVLAKVRLPIGEVIFPHVFLGPNFAFKTKARYTSEDMGSGAQLEANEADIRRSDIGGLVGAGIDIETRESGLFFTIDGRYGFGFNNVDRSDNAVELRNVGWSFAVGVGFLLKQ
ncbi:MAG: porin family protein [Chryseolinea sp.]